MKKMSPDKFWVFKNKFGGIKKHSNHSPNVEIKNRTIVFDETNYDQYPSVEIDKVGMVFCLDGWVEAFYPWELVNKTINKEKVEEVLENIDNLPDDNFGEVE